MGTIEKRVIVTRTSDGVFFYTLQIRKWFNFPMLKTRWKRVEPEFQPTYEDAINLVEPKLNSLEQTEAGGWQSNIPDVINRRELLLAYLEFYAKGTGTRIEALDYLMIDSFLSQ